MTRLHSSSKGKSGSKRPIERKSGEWVEMKPKEAEELIVNLANAGNSPSQIGLILRDQHGVPDVKALTKKTVSKILEENKIASDIPVDLLNLIKKSVKEFRHMEKNRKDQVSKRGYQLTVSKIRRLAKNYIKTKKLPADWRYTPEKAALMVK